MRDLARHIPRYRAVIEGWAPAHTTQEQVTGYLSKLAGQLGMTLVDDPTTSWCEHGWAGWAHITTSGIEFMGYPQDDGREFITVDPYSCRPFDVAAAARLTAGFFAIPEGQLEYAWIRLSRL